MSKRTDLDRLAQLPEADLAAVVAVVESAIVTGNGFLVREQGGTLRALDALSVVITERTSDGTEPDVPYSAEGGTR